MRGAESGGEAKAATRCLSLRDAARYLSLSYWTVRDMALRGDIPLVRAGRRILIDRHDLDSWIERSKER
jgi:excisionase family DNA binding protein